MKAPLYDRFLVLLVLLSPLALVILSKWQSSLEVWYVPEGSSYQYLGDAFTTDVNDWLNTQNKYSPTLYFLYDRECPCTAATLKILRDSLEKSPKRELSLIEIDIAELFASGATGAKIVRALPSTPTLFAAEGERLKYAGPVTSGSFCTVGVQRILGLSILESTQATPILNSLDKGCYCRADKIIN